MINVRGKNNSSDLSRDSRNLGTGQSAAHPVTNYPISPAFRAVNKVTSFAAAPPLPEMGRRRRS